MGFSAPDTLGATTRPLLEGTREAGNPIASAHPEISPPPFPPTLPPSSGSWIFRGRQSPAAGRGHSGVLSRFKI